MALRNDFPLDWDEKRAGLVIPRIITAWREKNFRPFRQPFPEERYLPAGMAANSREFALLSFHACLLMRGSIISDTAFKIIVNIWRFNQDIFDPEKSAAMTVLELKKEIIHALGRESLFTLDEIAYFWRRNDSLLVERYNGDPLGLFVGVDTHEQLFQRMTADGFKIFGPKVISLWIHWLIKAKLINSRQIDFPPPIDFHIMRILIATEVVLARTLPEPWAEGVRSEVLAKKLQGPIKAFCGDNGISPVDFSDAFWLLGSYGCKRNWQLSAPGVSKLQEKWARVKVDTRQPLPRHFRKQQMRELLVNNRPTTACYHCRFCPVKNFCVRAVPWVWSYRFSEMLWVGRMQHPLTFFD